jgi:Flp pilus assembly protein TadG
MRRFARHTGGAAALEFALTAPVFFGFLIGVATMGLGLYAKLALQHSVEMAARCASVDTSTCKSTSDVQNYAVGQSYGLSPSPSIFTISTAACGSQVQATYPVTFNFGPLGSKTVTLTASSCFPT